MGGPRPQHRDRLHERLRAIIEASGESQEAVARRLGVDRSTLSRLISTRQRRWPRVETLLAIAGWSGVSVDWLLGLEEGPTGSRSTPGSMMLMPLGAGPRDEAMLSWIAEAAGTKIRYVPVTIPELAKTSAVAALGPPGGHRRRAGELQESVAAHLDWARQAGTDMECCTDLHVVEDLRTGTGPWEQLGRQGRLEQLGRMIEVVEELYPRFRLFLHDGRYRQVAPFTVLGTRRVALYVAGMYLVLRDPPQVAAFIESFDQLLRTAAVQPTDVVGFLSDLRRRTH